MAHPVIKGVRFVLAHTPDLVACGSKPLRELPRASAGERAQFDAALRDFPAAVSYGPNQVMIGNLRPEDQGERPWFTGSQRPAAARRGPHGEIVPQAEFYGWLKLVDRFDLIALDEAFVAELRPALAAHPLVDQADLARLTGEPAGQVAGRVAAGALPLRARDGSLVGALSAAHDVDDTLSAQVLLENLACKASGVIALRDLLRDGTEVEAGGIDYLIGCGEEAVGDRYQRGGGAMAKAIGEAAGCVNASGGDLKAFCCAPIHALVFAAGMVQAGVFEQVAVVGGGALAKLGMKYQGHLAQEMPILEDVLGAVAILVGPDDGRNPRLRLDTVGKHPIGAGSTPQAMMTALVVAPLERHGLRLSDVDKYALELHNPEVTEPAGSGDVPRTNYRTLAAIAALRGEIARTDLDGFVAARGMPGFSPTQGHIAAAVPFLGHARDRILAGEIERAMFVAKGSLFLGRMTQLSDGMSFLLEPN